MKNKSERKKYYRIHQKRKEMGGTCYSYDSDTIFN